MHAGEARTDQDPHYRLAVLSCAAETEARWVWTLRRDETVAATGESGDIETACRTAAFAAAADAALRRISRRRF